MRTVWLVLIYSVSMMIALFGFEVMVERGYIGVPFTRAGVVDFQRMAKLAAKRRGVEFDSRTDLEIIQDERSTLSRVYPTVSPSWYLRKDGSRIVSRGEPVVPIGQPSHASSYYCNESGAFAKFESDRHGMRNPDSVWSEASTDVLIVGDSFAFGSCLAERESIAGLVRQSYPKTINTAQGANGPLFALAAIREYAVPREARNVFWLFFENDFDDLNRERKHPILMRYLDSNFSQTLIDRAAELSPLIDEEVERYFQLLLALSSSSQTVVQRNPLGLTNTRGLAKTVFQRLTSTPKAEARDLQLFMEIITKARDDVERYGGRFTLIYVPDCSTVGHGRADWRPGLMSLLEKGKFTLLDGEKLIADARPEAFYFCPGSHFTPAGASLIAGLITASLEGR